MRVLMVDDSAVARLLLREIIESDGHEVHEAVDGVEALIMMPRVKPDIITMDVHMPGMDGYETARRILSKYPVPIIVVTASADSRAALTAMRALEAGALAVVEKPLSPDQAGFDACVDDLLHTLRVSAGVKVAQLKVSADKAVASVATAPDADPRALAGRRPSVIAIGASAGGPVALRVLLQGLTNPQPWSFVIAQHIAAGFVESLAEWLNAVVSLEVRLARNLEPMRPGVVYLPPDGKQIEFAADGAIRLASPPASGTISPSIDAMFWAVARGFGAGAVGIQLSGMGRDGAAGLATMAARGALTIVQTPRSALIDSMPRAALSLVPSSRVMAPEEISAWLDAAAGYSVTHA